MYRDWWHFEVRAICVWMKLWEVVTVIYKHASELPCVSVIRGGVRASFVPSCRLAKAKMGGRGGGEDGSASFTKEQPHQPEWSEDGTAVPSVVKTESDLCVPDRKQSGSVPFAFLLHLRVTWFHNYTIEQRGVCLHWRLLVAFDISPAWIGVKNIIYGKSIVQLASVGLAQARPNYWIRSATAIAVAMDRSRDWSGHRVEIAAHLLMWLAVRSLGACSSWKFRCLLSVLLRQSYKLRAILIYNIVFSLTPQSFNFTVARNPSRCIPAILLAKFIYLMNF